MSPDTTDPTATTARSTADQPDLSYLHPDNLRLGGTGVFAGDWAWIESPGRGQRIPVGIVGVLIDTWNGWAVFTCTREVTEAIVADQQRIRDAERARLVAEGVDRGQLTARLDEAHAPMYFDGDAIVVDERAVYDDPDALSRITARPDGRFVVCGWSWTWTAVDPADCDRIAGQIPAQGEHQQYVMLTHTDMRLPHDRLRVSSLTQMPTHNGVAFTAVLRLDGKQVATIENTGTGGPTTYHTINSGAFNRRHLQEYVRGCCRREEPATEEAVLNALIDERDLNRAIHRAQTKGATLVRLLDEDGHQFDLLTVRPAPTNGADRAALAARLTAQHPHPHGVQWQIWSGTAWRHLARVDATNSPPATDSPGPDRPHPPEGPES